MCIINTTGHFLPYWDWDKLTDIWRTTFSKHFLHCIPNEFRLSLFFRFQCYFANSANGLALNGDKPLSHFNDIIMRAMASKITGVTIVYSAVYSGADQRKHQSSTGILTSSSDPIMVHFAVAYFSLVENWTKWNYHNSNDHLISWLTRHKKKILLQSLQMIILNPPNASLTGAISDSKQNKYELMTNRLTLLPHIIISK